MVTDYMTETPSETLREEIFISLNSQFPVLKKLFGIRSIGIFGRFAQGEEPSDDVVELQVEFDPSGDRFGNYMRLIAYLEEKFGKRVTLVTTRVLNAGENFRPVSDRMGADDDRVKLQQILRECMFIQQRKRTVSFEEFIRDEQMKRAVCWSMEQIGDAAAGLSPLLREAHPDVPWGILRGLRDNLLQNPFGVDWVLLWSAIQDEIPPTEQKIRGMTART
jgi:uncharacterized protein with HEPN domain/predicted nucleotidyltransferase